MGHIEFIENPEVIPAGVSDSELDSFFAPVQFDRFDLMVDEFNRAKARIEEVHEIIRNERFGGALDYFLRGNARDKYGRRAALIHARSVDEVFNLEGAVNQLTADFWERALAETGLREIMPQKRRDEWEAILTAWSYPGYCRGKDPELDMPEFSEAILRSTLYSLFARRVEFLAERVDGVFRGLSNTHVTNAPEAFGKRFIMSKVICPFDTRDDSKTGIIHDLRLIIAMFAGRDEPTRESTAALITAAQRSKGCWVEADAGALRVKLYKVGTAHLEVHPAMVWRLNGVLAHLYPQAIPEAFRKRPVKAKASGFQSKELYDRPFSHAAAGLLSLLEQYYSWVPSTAFDRDYDRITVPNALCIKHEKFHQSRQVTDEASAILESLGAVFIPKGKDGYGYWQFDYDAADLVREVAVMGCVPDQKSHQYYPTPIALGERLVDLLEIEEGDSILEPEAGQGGLAGLLPKDQTMCVEISPLFCHILREKGFSVEQADFLTWNPERMFDVVVMNPPYSDGRWQAHLEKAGRMLAAKGRIGAVLPVTAVQKAAQFLPGMTLEFSEPIQNAFPGASVTVVLMIGVKE